MSQFNTELHNHEKLQILLDRLHVMVVAPADALPDRRWCNLFVHEVEAFQEAMEIHMSAEEKGGYMHELVELHPELARKAATLKEEHSKFHTALATLLAAARKGEDAAGLRSQIQDFLTEVYEHEVAETDLVQEALQRDIGPAD